MVRSVTDLKRSTVKTTNIEITFLYWFYIGSLTPVLCKGAASTIYYTFMRGSRIFFRGGGGGVVQARRPDNSLDVVFFCCFFSPTYSTVYRGGPMVLSQRKLYFSKDPEGVHHFPERGGPVPPSGSAPAPLVWCSLYFNPGPPFQKVDTLQTELSRQHFI